MLDHYRRYLCFESICFPSDGFYEYGLGDDDLVAVEDAEQGYNNSSALIIGAGKVGMALAQEMKKRPGLGIRVVGFLDDTKTTIADQTEVKILGKISHVADGEVAKGWKLIDKQADEVGGYVMLEKNGVKKIHIMLSHDGNYGIANVILEG